LVILLIRFFASLHISSPTDWPSFVTIVVVTMVIVAAPAVVMAMTLTTKPFQALLLRRPAWATIPCAAMLAVCLHPFAMATGAIVRHLYPIDEGTYKSMAGMVKILADAPSTLQLLLVMGLLPAICEELAFRGFILSGLRRLGSKWRAIILSSIFFGLAHFALQQSVIAGIFGLVLGFLAVQTGSLMPCIAFHAVHNSLNILSTKFIPATIELLPNWSFLFRESIEFGEVHHVYNWPVLAVCGVFALLLLRWFRSQTPCTFVVEERLHEAIDKKTPVSMAVR
jgi:sodium transport system permease protein